MITRVPMNISAGTRDARELLVSLLVESLLPIPNRMNKWMQDANTESHSDSF